MSEDEDRTSDDVDTDLENSYQELLDVNQHMLMLSRQKAHNIRELQQFYLQQAERCEVIAELHIEGAILLGEVIGDILSSEWGITREEVEGEEEDDE